MINQPDPIQHDPRTKQQIKKILYRLLYEPISDIFAEREKQIIIKNTVAGKFAHKSFRYKGLFYNWDSSLLPRKANPLLPQFHDEMEEYLKELQELNEKEVPYVLGFINQVLNSSNYFQDYLRLFPEAVHHSIQHLVETCPCKSYILTEEDIQTIQQKNQDAIFLMKQRMAINLIL